MESLKNLSSIFNFTINNLISLFVFTFKVEHEASLDQNTATEMKDIHTTLERKKTNERSTICSCTIVERQQREIVSLKRKLQEREVYGPSTKSYSENR